MKTRRIINALKHALHGNGLIKIADGLFARSQAIDEVLDLGGEDVHIRKLRQKIGEDHIVTIKGVGYKFEK